MSDYVVSTYAEALFKLMKDKNIEKITVDELCKTGGIGRATYFRNFKSKDGIITSYIIYYISYDIYLKNSTKKDITLPE